MFQTQHARRPGERAGEEGAPIRRGDARVETVQAAVGVAVRDVVHGRRAVEHPHGVDVAVREHLRVAVAEERVVHVVAGEPDGPGAEVHWIFFQESGKIAGGRVRQVGEVVHAGCLRELGVSREADARFAAARVVGAGGPYVGQAFGQIACKPGGAAERRAVGVVAVAAFRGDVALRRDA